MNSEKEVLEVLKTLGNTVKSLNDKIDFLSNQVAALTRENNELVTMLMAEKNKNMNPTENKYSAAFK